MASFSYASHVRAETGTKRPLAASIGEDLTSVAKRTAAPFSGTAARPDRGTNATIPVARWSLDALQEGDIAFVNRASASGIKPGYFLHSVSMTQFNIMMSEEEFLVNDPQLLFSLKAPRHSYVCNAAKQYQRSSASKVFDKNKLPYGHPARSYALEGVVSTKTDALHPDGLIDIHGAEGVVAVGGLGTLNTYNHSAASKSRVLDHVYIVLMAKKVKPGRHALQCGIINSLHIWHGHFEKHYPDCTVLSCAQLGRIVDTNYAYDRDNRRLLKIIVAIKPLVARVPSKNANESGMVPVDADKVLKTLKLADSTGKKVDQYKGRIQQLEQQKGCKSNISLRKFSNIHKPAVLTGEQIQKIDILNKQVKLLQEEKSNLQVENIRLAEVERQKSELQEQLTVANAELAKLKQKNAMSPLVTTPGASPPTSPPQAQKNTCSRECTSAAATSAAAVAWWSC